MTTWLEILTAPVALTGWALLLLCVRWVGLQAAGRTRWLLMALTVGYFLVAAPFGANLAVAWLESRAAPAADCLAPGPDAVFIVLAGGITGAPRSEQEFWSLKEASARRTFEAVALAEKHPGSTIVMSGGAGDTVREADLMRALAARLGIAPARIEVERNSTSTLESAEILARRSELWIRGQPFLVTSAMHMPRAVGAFRAAGIQVCAHPVDFRWVRPAPHEAFIPQVSALEKSTRAIHEIAGLLAYSLGVSPR